MSTPSRLYRAAKELELRGQAEQRASFERLLQAREREVRATAGRRATRGGWGWPPKWSKLLWKISDGKRLWFR